MIDTDKYKGHTPVRKEWPRWCEDWLFSVYADNGSHIPNWNQDNNLACDAPLLLEEVKRLREKIKTEHNLKLWEKAEVKRLREESKKQLDVLSKLDEMIRYGKDHVELMKALEQGLDLPETWKEMIE